MSEKECLLSRAGAAQGADAEAVAARLAEEAGLGVPVAVVPLQAGGNNRVYRVDCPGSRALLKEYYQEAGQRDRAAGERAFAEYATARGLPVPRPLARTAGFGLYEFIEGRRLEPGEASWERLGQALDFLVQLNRDRTGAERLPEGAEACFEPGAHLRVVDRRVASLLSVDSEGEVAIQAARFLRGELKPLWERVRERAEAALSGMTGPEPDARIVSPSDFGFHNALLTNRSLYFYDFEYAGWDDPAKTVCDFFCQPAVPAPRAYMGRFVAGLAAEDWTDADLSRRVEALLPVYEVKWVTILLNEFRPAGLRRRLFASRGDPDRRRREQLDKARRALSAIR